MTSTAKTAAATNLDLSALVEGEPANSTDVSVPFTEAEDAIDGARSTLSVTANDTHVKNLDDALTVSAPLTKTVTSPSGDEKLNLALNAAALSLDAGQIDTGTVDRARLPAFVGTDGISPGDVGIVPAPTEFDSGKYLRADGTWQAVAGSGTVTSVAVTPPSDLFTVTGSPITAAGTITFAKVSQPAARVYATPAGAAGVPELIPLEAAHIPAIPSSKLSDRGMTEIVGLTSISTSAASFTISVPNSYDHLQIWALFRTNNAAANDGLQMRINSDTNSANYYAEATRIWHSATLGTAESLGANPGIQFNTVLTGDAALSGTATFMVINIYNYKSTSMHKFVAMHGTRAINNTTANIMNILGSGYWTNNAAITSLTFFPVTGTLFIAPTSYSAYGIG